MSRDNLNIHLWAPNIFGFKGGIQRFSRFLLDSLNREGHDVTTYLKLDMQKSVPQDYSKIYTFGDKLKFFNLIIFSLFLIFGALRKRPHLIISTHLNFGPVALLIYYLTKTPYWLVAHGVDAWSIRGFFRNIAFRNATKIIAVSNYTKARIQEDKKIDPAKVEVLYNTFEEDFFTIGDKSSSLMTKHSITAQNQVILSVCRFDSEERYKGYDLILEALPDLLIDFPNLLYLVVGSGDDLSRFKNDLIQRKLEQHVIIVGSVSDIELLNYYRLCDIFVLPSSGEGFGIVFLEALGCGKPVIGGNLDGSQDALCNGELGLLINPHSKEDLKGAISTLIRKKCANPIIFSPEVLRKEVLKRFGREVFVSQLAKLIRTLEIGAK